MAKRPAFITLNDHKENFDNNPTCRLINTAKSELNKVSKIFLDRINKDIRTAINVNQWRNSSSIISWFNSIKEKNKYSFLTFDIVRFYSSIFETLLDKAVSWANNITTIDDNHKTIIKHAHKSLLFNDDQQWVKKNARTFDVTMVNFDGAEICELVGLFILDSLAKTFGSNNVGLYRDDGPTLLKNATGRLADKARKDLIKIFGESALKTIAQYNKQITNFLDITLNLQNGKH